MEIIVAVTQRRERPPISDRTVPPAICELINMCWHPVDSKRPPFTKVRWRCGDGGEGHTNRH